MFNWFIEKISDLNFANISPNDILIAHTKIAECFASDIRVCLSFYEKTDNDKYSIMLELSEWENDTNNIQFEDFEKWDHWQFLDFFIKKRNLIPSNKNINTLCNNYETIASNLSPDDRFQLLVQTEMNYHAIFDKILKAHDRDTLGYDFFLYYVKKHEEFDLEDGGHSDLLKKYFDVDNIIVSSIREERIKLFKSLEVLDKNLSVS